MWGQTDAPFRFCHGPFNSIPDGDVSGCALSLAQPAVAEHVPYEARVATPAAQVRSGPGEKFYPTDTLAHGETVEVYREEPGGWLAIRPPKDSFSWISGSRISSSATAALAEVDKDDVASRIGSRLSDQRNAAQVRLKKGEVVEIIGEESSEARPGTRSRRRPANSAGSTPRACKRSAHLLSPPKNQKRNKSSYRPLQRRTPPHTRQKRSRQPPCHKLLPRKLRRVKLRAPSAGGASAPTEVVAPPLADVSATPAPPTTPTKIETAHPRSAALPPAVPPAPLPAPNPPPPPSAGNVPERWPAS